MATLIYIIDELIQKTPPPANAVVKIINEELSKRRYLTKIINESIERVGPFLAVQIINEGSQVKEGRFDQAITITPIIQIVNETERPLDSDVYAIISITANHLVKVIDESSTLTEYIRSKVTFSTPIVTTTYGPGVKGPAQFKRWFDCAICGFSYPEDQMTRQRGVLVCKEDVDQKSHSDYRREGEPSGEEPREAPWAVDGEDL